MLLEDPPLFLLFSTNLDIKIDSMTKKYFCSRWCTKCAMISHGIVSLWICQVQGVFILVKHMEAKDRKGV